MNQFSVNFDQLLSEYEKKQEQQQNSYLQLFKTQLDELEHLATERQQSINSLTQANQRLQMLTEQLTTQLQQLNSENQQLQQQINELTAANNELQTALQTINKYLIISKKNNQDLIAIFDKEINGYRQQIIELQNLLQQLS